MRAMFSASNARRKVAASMDGVDVHEDVGLAVTCDQSVVESADKVSIIGPSVGQENPNCLALWGGAV